MRYTRREIMDVKELVAHLRLRDVPRLVSVGGCWSGI